MHGPCLTHAWPMPVPCLSHACPMPVPCLCHAWPRPVPCTVPCTLPCLGHAFFYTRCISTVKGSTRQHGLESDIIFSGRYYNVLDSKGNSRDKYRDFQNKVYKLIDYDSANTEISRLLNEFGGIEYVVCTDSGKFSDRTVSLSDQKEARYLSRNEYFQIKIRNNKLINEVNISLKFKRKQLFVYYSNFQSIRCVQF